MLKVDAGNNRVGIGTGTPGGDFEVKMQSNVRFVIDDTIDNQVTLRAIQNGGTTNAMRIASDNLQFLTAAGSTTPAERMRIESDGAVLIGTTTDGSAGAGDLVVNGGVFLGGSAAANELDDYEEGTWTPTFNRGGSQITIGIIRANYTKVGRLVHCTMHAVNNSGAQSNSYIIGDGLPFTSASINVTGCGGGFAVHPGSGNSNMDVGICGAWTQDNDWYLVPSYNGSNGYRYMYNWANGAYMEAAFWYYAA